LVLIAGGIGVTPMRSMLPSMRDRRDRRPALLVYAARNRSRAVFAGELEALRAELDLRVVFVFEEPEPGWTGERGLVDLRLLERIAPVHTNDVEFFVCGPGPMMDVVERALVELGVPPERVQTERFDLI
jgi:ferredoxin-NADP reductase